jgi:hypothetical protein
MVDFSKLFINIIQFDLPPANIGYIVNDRDKELISKFDSIVLEKFSQNSVFETKRLKCVIIHPFTRFDFSEVSENSRAYIVNSKYELIYRNNEQEEISVFGWIGAEESIHPDPAINREFKRHYYRVVVVETK